MFFFRIVTRNTYVNPEAVIAVRADLLVKWSFHNFSGYRIGRQLHAVAFAGGKVALGVTEGQLLRFQHLYSRPSHHRRAPAAVVDYQLQSWPRWRFSIARDQINALQLGMTRAIGLRVFLSSEGEICENQRYEGDRHPEYRCPARPPAPIRVRGTLCFSYSPPSHAPENYLLDTQRRVRPDAPGSGSRSGSRLPTRSAGCRGRGYRRRPSASAPGASGSRRRRWCCGW